MQVSSLLRTTITKSATILSSRRHYTTLFISYEYLTNATKWRSHRASVLKKQQNKTEAKGSIIVYMTTFNINTLKIDFFLFDPDNIYLQALPSTSILQMSYYLFIAFSVLCLYVFYVYYLKPKAEIKRYKAIFIRLNYRVYEQKFSFFGISVLNDWEKGIEDHRDALYTEITVYPHIDISIGNYFDRVMIFITHPDLIQEFLAANMVYKYPKYLKALQSFTTVMGQKGLLFNEGQDWKKRRKLLSKAFSYDLLNKNIPEICRICDRAFDEADQKYSIEANKFKYDVATVSGTIFNRVIMKCFFDSDRTQDEIKGLKYDDFIRKVMNDQALLNVEPIMIYMGKIAWKLGLTRLIRQCKQNIRLMRQKAMEIINQRTKEVINSPKNQNCSDIIQALIYEKMNNNKDFSYSDQEIVDEFQTFLIAGIDTTTSFFTMMVYYLGKYPEIHRKLREHINSIIKTDQDITHENLKKLTYIDWIQKETTRHYGPVVANFERQALEDNFIKDIPITKGTIVVNQQLGPHYSEKYFKDPLQFRPERWESECDKIHPFAFVGFSAGPRTCIGKHLALLQSKIALVKLMRRYDSIEVPSEITKVFTSTYQPENYEVQFTKNKKE